MNNNLLGYGLWSDYAKYFRSDYLQHFTCPVATQVLQVVRWWLNRMRWNIIGQSNEHFLAISRKLKSAHNIIIHW